MELLDNFLQNYTSTHTRNSYKQDIEEFTKFIGSISFSQLKVKDFIQYRDSLHELSSATINRKISSLKSFMRWGMTQGHFKDNPVDAVRLPKITVESPTLAFTDEEVQSLLKSPNINTFNGNVHSLILKFLFNLGLRRSELVAIKLNDFYEDKEGLVLRIKGKGGKQRRMPIQGELLNSYRKYLTNLEKSYNIKLSMTDYLFQSRADVKNTKSMDGASIYRIVTTYAKLVGIDRRIGAHSCRATAISHLLEKGVSPRDVADFAGHSSINTTINSYDKKRDGIKNSAVLKIAY